MPESVELLIVYAQRDKKLEEELEIYITLLMRQGLITAWRSHALGNESDVQENEEMPFDIAYINSSSIILLLISPDFLDSDYFSSTQMQRILERQRSNEAQVIPILLRQLIC